MSYGRRLLRIGILVIVMVGFSVGLAGPASAHDVLISSNPPDGASLTKVPASVTFTFDQPAQNFDSVVSLIGPDGKQYAAGKPSVSGNTVTGTVTAGPAGAYTAAYRVVSSDGHPVTGEVHFTLAGDNGPSSVASSGGSPAASEAASAVASASAGGPAAQPPNSSAVRSDSSGLSAWLWIGLIAAAVVIAFAAVLLIRRPASRGGKRNDT